MNTFGERLKTLREIRNVSQEDLAKALQIGRTSISAYEKGKAMPTAPVIVAIAQYFGVSADYLLGLTDNPTPCNNELPQHIKKELEECRKLREKYEKSLKALKQLVKTMED